MPRTRELTGDHLAFWRERHLCTVTTLRADGSPHVVPMGVVVDPLPDGTGGTAWAITSGSSYKVRHVRADPRVSVCQVDGRRWSTIEGIAEVLTDPEDVAEACARYAERYRQPRENPERVGLRITLTRITGNV